MKQTKYIVIEGIDGSWKGTQTKLLCDTLKEKWYNVLQVSFPRYETPIGQIISKYLKWQYKTPLTITQASILFSLDRMDFYQSLCEEDLSQYDYIVTDRYTSSNLIHQWVKLFDDIDHITNTDISEKSVLLMKYQNWLYDLEYNSLQIPTPTTIIYLNVDYTICLHNIDKRWREKDDHETQQHLQKAYKVWQFFKEFNSWDQVDCDDWNTMFDEEYIHQKIVDIVLNT